MWSRRLLCSFVRSERGQPASVRESSSTPAASPVAPSRVAGQKADDIEREPAAGQVIQTTVAKALDVRTR